MTSETLDTWSPESGLAIQQASELLGVPAATLRSWERRYGLPSTPRSRGGHRRYSEASLHELRLMRDEVAHGRPAADAARKVRMLLYEGGAGAAWVEELLEASSHMDRAAIHRTLDRAAAELGSATMLDLVLLPSMRQIGNWWAAGRCDVGQEHLTTSAVRDWLAQHKSAVVGHDSPPIVLACGPRDQHTLALEALDVLLAERGRASHLLGARTPTAALVSCVGRVEAGAVLVVSQLPTHRRVTAETITAVAATGCPTFYAGNAFLFASARKHLPGTYLGESLAEATELLLASS